MKKKPTKIVELVISDESQEMTIDAISLVNNSCNNAFCILW